MKSLMMILILLLIGVTIFACTMSDSESIGEDTGGYYYFYFYNDSDWDINISPNGQSWDPFTLYSGDSKTLELTTSSCYFQFDKADLVEDSVSTSGNIVHFYNRTILIVENDSAYNMYDTSWSDIYGYRYYFGYYDDSLLINGSIGHYVLYAYGDYDVYYVYPGSDYITAIYDDGLSILYFTSSGIVTVDQHEQIIFYIYTEAAASIQKTTKNNIAKYFPDSENTFKNSELRGK